MVSTSVRWDRLQMLRHACKASVFVASGPDGAGGCSNLAQPPRTRRRAYSRWPYPGLRSPRTRQSPGGYAAKRLVQLHRLPMVRRGVHRINRGVLVLGRIKHQFLAKAEGPSLVHMGSTSSNNGSGAHGVQPILLLVFSKHRRSSHAVAVAHSCVGPRSLLVTWTSIHLRSRPHSLPPQSVAASAPHPEELSSTPEWGLGSFGYFWFATREALASELVDAHGVRIEFNRGVRGRSAGAAVSWRWVGQRWGARLVTEGLPRLEIQYCDAWLCAETP